MNYTEEELPRYQLSKLNILELNIEIGAYEKVIESYESYLLREGENAWIDERLVCLYGQLSEYMIAKELNIEKTKIRTIKEEN